MPPQATCDCGQCAKCRRRLYMRKWYQNKTTDERRAWVLQRNPEVARRNDRTRYFRDKEKRLAAAREYAQSESGKAAASRANLKYSLRYPERRVAHWMTSNAIRDGRLRRGPCAFFGVSLRVHAHHNDYTKPLDIVWLCPEHHRVVHVSIPMEISP